MRQPSISARLHRGLVAVHGLAHVRDLLTLLEVDLADIRRLEEIAEEPDELLALGRRTLLPVRPQRALGRLLEVEETVGRLADRCPSRGPIGLALHDLEHFVHAASDLIGGLAGYGGPGGDKGEDGGQREGAQRGYGRGMGEPRGPQNGKANG